MSLWHQGEPDEFDAENNKCVVSINIAEQFLWKTTSCLNQYPFVCIKSKKKCCNTKVIFLCVSYCFNIGLVSLYQNNFNLYTTAAIEINLFLKIFFPVV